MALLGLPTWLALLLLTNHAVSVPSPQSIGSDLSILTHNDLYGNASTRQAAAIVLGASGSHSKALAGCEALHETLWNPENQTELGFLRYLNYGKHIRDVGQYWVGSGSDSTVCRAITPFGTVKTVRCDTSLPALCSQSAPLSSNTSSDTSPTWQTTVRTGNATVVGYRDKLSFRFLGINFASFPSRFTYSSYKAPHGTVSALAYGPECIQVGCNAPTCSEQCLYLNIWTPHLPSSPRSAKKAVMFWIHGGAWLTGSGSDPTFDGGNMASRGDVVVVTINYRLSTLGFLALDNTTSSGNYWLSDQLAALDWVRNHIEDFGGNKNKITVFGQSAGCASVRALLASPRSEGKFSKAIMQSCPGGLGSARAYESYSSIPNALNTTRVIAEEKNCTQQEEAGRAACLRALDPTQLVRVLQAPIPIVDGEYLITSGLRLDGSGPALDIPIMAGVMHDDGDPFISIPTSPNVSLALSSHGIDADALLSSGLFPLPQSANATMDIFNLTSRVSTDATFRCVAESTVSTATKNRVFPVVYSYEIDRSWQLIEWSPNPPTCEAPKTTEHPLGDTSLPYYKCHSGELYYVFGTGIRQGRPPRDQEDVPFSQYLLDSWTAFGRTADPNPEKGFLKARGYSNTSAVVERVEPWRPTSVGHPKSRILNVQPREEHFREQAQCELLGLPLDYYSS